jgi:hypothetical protein
MLIARPIIDDAAPMRDRLVKEFAIPIMQRTRPISGQQSNPFPPPVQNRPVTGVVSERSRISIFLPRICIPGFPI